MLRCTSMNLTFRDYSPSDEEAYVHIWNERLKICSWFSTHGSLSIDDAKKAIERSRKDSTYRLIFAFSDSAPVGFIEAKMDDVETGRIFPYRPCVLPMYLQRDVDTALVKAAVEHLQKYGAKN